MGRFRLSHTLPPRPPLPCQGLHGPQADLARAMQALPRGDDRASAAAGDADAADAHAAQAHEPSSSMIVRTHLTDDHVASGQFTIPLVRYRISGLGSGHSSSGDTSRDHLARAILPPSAAVHVAPLAEGGSPIKFKLLYLHHLHTDTWKRCALDCNPQGMRFEVRGAGPCPASRRGALAQAAPAPTHTSATCLACL